MNKIYMYSFILAILASFFGYSQVGSTRKYTKFTDYEVVPVYGLNTSYNEFSPVLYQKNLVFISDREYDIKTLGEGNWNRINHVNIFKADFENIFNDSILLENITLFDNLLVKDDHVGPIVFNREGTEAIVSMVSHKNTKSLGVGTATPQLYIVKQVDGKWKTIESLPFNNAKYSLAQPAWSVDGKSLYFALNKKPGTKESDIYMVSRNENSWGNPKKVEDLNTSYNEMFPYLIGNKIYFSSDREGGKGGLDLYMAEFKDGKWSEPKNLGGTINTGSDEFAMVFNVNKTSGYFCSNRPLGKGKDDIYAFNKIDKTIVENKSLTGVLTFRYLNNKSTEGLEIGMFDEDGNLIEVVKADANGKFIFKKIPTDNKFSLKMIDVDDEIEMVLYGDKEGIVLISDKEGNFIYRRLSNSKIGTMALMDEEDLDFINKKGELAGQFIFKKLTGKNKEGMDIMLVDEDGNIIMRSSTDEYGNFIFKNVSLNKNYTLKAASEEDYDILIFNKKEQLIARLAKDGKGNFVFRKLSNLGGVNILEGEEEELLVLEKRVSLTGQFVYQRSKNSVGVLAIEVHDENGLLKKVSSTKEGDFMAVGMQMRDQYKFKIIDESTLKEEPILNITNRYHQTVAVLHRDNQGFYVFDKSEDFNLGDSVVNIEVIQVEQTNIQNTEIIFYENNESRLTKDDEKILDKRIEELKEDSDLLIRIEAYASSKGSAAHNKELTLKRKAKVLQYLTAHGIHESRIKAFSYGKARSQEEQDEEQQRLSRKTELTLFKLK